MALDLLEARVCWAVAACLEHVEEAPGCTTYLRGRFRNGAVRTAKPSLRSRAAGSSNAQQDRRAEWRCQRSG